MKDRSKQVGAATVGVGAVVAVVMVRTGMEPRLVLFACIILLGGVTWLLFADLGTEATSMVWHRPIGDADTSRQSDRRVVLLRARLRSRTPRAGPRGLGSVASSEASNDEIVASLIMVIDDHLLAEHGIDRSVDPHGAAQVIGDDLARFARDPSAQRSMTRPRTLAHTIDLIESL